MSTTTQGGRLGVHAGENGDVDVDDRHCHQHAHQKRHPHPHQHHDQQQHQPSPTLMQMFVLTMIRDVADADQVDHASDDNAAREDDL